MNKIIILTLISQLTVITNLYASQTNSLPVTAVYVHGYDWSEGFIPVNDIQAVPYNISTDQNQRVFHIDPSKHAQQYLGVGSSFEEASVYNFTVLATEQERNQRLQKLFGNGPQDFHWNLVRVTFGTSDFTPRVKNGKYDRLGEPYYYTYDDNNGVEDRNLEHFNLHQGIDDLEQKKINLILDSKKINPDLLLFASSWSPPSWMKLPDPRNQIEAKAETILDPLTYSRVDSPMIGGVLNAKYVDDLARYYTKALLEYRNYHIGFYAMSELNEPCVGRDTPVRYPNACIESDDAKTLLLAMKKHFQENNLHTRIWMNDYNFGNAYHNVDSVLNSDDAIIAADGIAFHSYYGNVAEIKNYFSKPYIGDNQPTHYDDTLQTKVTYKGIYMSEFMTGWFWRGSHLYPERIYDATRLLEFFHQGASSYINWVTLRDDRMGIPSGAAVLPHEFFFDPWYPPNIISMHDKYEDYDFMGYVLGSIAKFVQPGGNEDLQKNAYVLAETEGANHFYATYFDRYEATDFISANPDQLPKVSQISFENPDHSLVTVVVNTAHHDVDIKIVFPVNGTEYQMLVTVPAESIETFYYLVKL